MTIVDLEKLDVSFLPLPPFQIIGRLIFLTSNSTTRLIQKIGKIGCVPLKDPKFRKIPSKD